MTDSCSDKKGKVYLVGAGPGDVKLITLRACELLLRADVIIYDHLANPKILKFASDGAEIIYVGKSSHNHTMPQSEITDTIIRNAEAGKTVVRLKGGDPFVFGRGGEEASALVDENIEFEIVPGITSAISVPAYAGIPITSRTFATSFAVITGHESVDKSGCGIKWDKISDGVDTLVFLMGVEGLPDIVGNLISNGRPENTPVALVRWGTYPYQQTLIGTLADIVQKVKDANFKAPAVIVVGDVVKLREKISWYEKKPLFGRRIIVTRSDEQAEAFSEKLEELGADVFEYSTIRILPPKDYAELDSAISQMNIFNWVIFTSVNGVNHFFKRLLETKKDIRVFGQAKIGAIGSKTADAISDLKLNVDYIPSKYVAESVVAEFPDDIMGKRILIPRSANARSELPNGLTQKGADVCVVNVYRTDIDLSHSQDVRKTLKEGAVDIITFTSSSTVENFVALAGNERINDNAIVACIGPITAKTASDYGMKPSIVADEYTTDGLVDAIVRCIKQDDKCYKASL